MNIYDFIGLDLPVFPVNVEDKTPLTKNGFKDASSNRFQIEVWEQIYPNCGWGLATGEVSKILVIDLDVKHGNDGISEWEKLCKAENYTEKTLEVQTRSGGKHLYFRMPSSDIRNSTSKLADGIDVRANGGYAVIPPTTGYKFLEEFSLEKILELPEFVINRLPIRENPSRENPVEENKYSPAEIHAAVQKLSKERADDYDDWLNVGMVLHTLGDDYFSLWDLWSKQSQKYETGVCAKKWETFRTDGGLTVNSLFAWAELDSKGVYIRPANKDAKPSEYMSALHKMGYSFSMNRMNDRIYVNGKLMNDGIRAHLLTRLRESSYKNENVAEDAWISEGYENQFHPIEEYLNSLVWDGKDYISELCSYFKDKDGIFPLLLRKWLVGAVAKILGERRGEQNPLLVLDGKQGKGKSRFVWWLGSALPEFFKVSPIYPENKDYVIDSVSFFVWEVEELGSTIRKADREALKAFITQEHPTFRPPYGKYEITKYATCSYIGTINDEGGFLSDPTGNRRFRVCTLVEIDWNYSKNMNVNNIWAQAVALFRMGETSLLSQEENKRMDEINSRYEVEDTLTYYVYEIFNIEPSRKDFFMPTAEIISNLRNNGVVLNESENQITRRLGAVLTKLELDRDTKRVNGKLVRGWIGIYPKGLEQVEKLFVVAEKAQ